MSEDIKKDKLPIDARLLSEIIVELNISKYIKKKCCPLPKRPPLTSGSLKRAFSLFKKTFEIRLEITVGISKDTLIVDEYILDRKNPVFRSSASVFMKEGSLPSPFTQV